MALVGEAEILIKANTAAFKGELAAAADEAGGGLATKTDQIGQDAGAALSGGVAKESESLGKEMEKQGEKSGGMFSKAFKKPLEEGKGLLGNLGVPESLMTGWGAAAAAGAGIAAISVDMAMKMQEADTQIAISAGISTKAAKSIGDAFLSTAGTTKYSGQEQAVAFAAVAGQLKALQGSALTTKQSMDVMKTSMDLAEATGMSLDSATATLAQTMQAFQIPVKDSAKAADTLFNASKATGQGIDTLGQSLDRIKSRMGAAAPPMGELAGLLVDMTNHGITGRAALSGLSSVFTTLDAPVIAASKAQAQYQAALAQLPPQLQALAKSYTDGSITSTEWSKAQKNLSESQRQALAQFTTANTAVKTAETNQRAFGIQLTDTSGKMLPFRDIISELGEKIKGMNKQQALAELGALGFTSSAAQLLGVIQSGPAAYDKTVAAVTKSNSAHDAATLASKTLSDQFEVAKATLKDFGTQLGEMLLPIIQQLMNVLNQLIPVVGDALKTAFQILKPVIHDVMVVIKALMPVLTDVINFISDIFKGKWSAAWGDIKKLFEDAWNALITIVKTILGRLLSEVAKIPGEILKALGDLGHLLYNAGKAIIEGLANGMKDALHMAVDAVKHVGSSILNGVKDFFHIFSPSQVMADVGGNIVDGLTKGITDKTSGAISAAKDMAAKVKHAGTPGAFGAAVRDEYGTSASRGVIINIQSGAVVINPAPGNDSASLAATGRLVDEAFRQLAVDLERGVSALGKVHA
jgi:phage-related protein